MELLTLAADRQIGHHRGEQLADKSLGVAVSQAADPGVIARAAFTCEKHQAGYGTRYHHYLDYWRHGLRKNSLDSPNWCFA